MSKVRKTRTAQIDLNSPEAPPKAEETREVGGFQLSPQLLKQPMTASKKSPSKRGQRVSILTGISFNKPKQAQQIETQIVNKVEHVFHWGDGPRTKDFKVEITGEFNNWKRLPLHKVTGNNKQLQIPTEATHYVKRSLDPKKYTFHFVINNIDKMSTTYEKNIGQNTNYVDLKHFDTVMLVKKKSKPSPLVIGTALADIQEVQTPVSDYQTIEDYVNGEEVLLDEEHEKDIKVVQEIEESPRDDDAQESEPRVVEIDDTDEEDDQKSNRVVMVSDCDENSDQDVKSSNEKEKRKQITPSAFKANSQLKLHLSLTDVYEEERQDMAGQGFKQELDNFMSPEKTRGRITSRNSELKSPGLNYTFFNKYVPKSRKNSEILRKKSFGFGMNQSEQDVKSEQNQRLNCPSSDNSQKDPLDLDVASEVQDMALEIYDNVFSDVYEQNKYQTENGREYITKDQYIAEMEAMKEEDDESDDETKQQINHFIELYPKVDKKGNGKAYKDDLIRAIEKDIIEMQKQEEGEEDSPQVEDKSDKANEMVRTSSGSFARGRTQSQDMGETMNDDGLDVIFEKNNSQKDNLDNSEEIFFDSPSKRKQSGVAKRRSSGSQPFDRNSNEFRVTNRFSGVKQNENFTDSNVSSGAGSNLSEEEVAELDDNRAQTSARKNKRNSKLLNNFFNEFQEQQNDISGQGEARLTEAHRYEKVDMTGISDLTLIKLGNLTDQDNISGLERSENLIQIIDYIQQNNTAEYTKPKHFDCLLKLVKENQKKISTKVEEQHRAMENIKENGTLEQQAYHQQNRDLEAEVEILVADNEKLKRYETNYHTQEEKLKVELDRIDVLQIDKENLEQAHQDLINEYNGLKQNNEQYQIDYRAQKNEIEALTKQNASLKLSIIGGQAKDAESSEEKDQDLSFEFGDKNSDQENEEEQDIPQLIETIKKENFDQYKLSPSQVQVNKLTLEQEAEILYELNVHDTYILSERIKDYIINGVQLSRQGQDLIINKQYDKLVKYENKMRKKLIQMKLNNVKLFEELKQTRFQQTEYKNQYQEKRREVDDLQQKIQDLVNENNEMKDDKNRIIGVNQILEKRMQVEKSEMMSLQGDLQNLMTFGENAQGSVQGPQMSKMKSGQYSSYTRNLKHAIRSNKGSMVSGMQGMHNQNAYLKNQNRQHGGGQSSFHDNGSMYSGIQQSQTGTNYGNQGIMIFDNASNFSRSIRSRKIMNKLNNPSMRGSMRGSMVGSMKGSVFSGRGRDGERVQQINAYSSQGSDESILDITGDELTALNQDIENQQQSVLQKKRQQNVYDLVGLADPKHIHYAKVNAILKKHYEDRAKESGLKDRSAKLVELKDAEEKSFYSELVKVYINRSLKESILLIYQGIIYFIQLNETTKSASLLVQPFSLLDDLNRVIFSEAYDKFLALKLRDMRKTQGNRDHLVFELKDRELFADFVMEYAEDEEDEILFEANEEFSMIVNSSPVWFSFADVERCKKQDSKKQLKQKDVTGFLDMRQNKNNLLKIMFSKNAAWDNRYFALQGTKLFIYKGHDYNKPLQIIEISEDMKVAELSKKDTGGKQNVFQLTPGQDKPIIVLSASTQKTMETWIKSFKNIKDMFDQEKQKIIDKLKEEVVKKVTKKERVSVLFTQGGNLNPNQPQARPRDSVINEVDESSEGDSTRKDTSRPNNRKKKEEQETKPAPQFDFDDLFTMESGMRKQTIHKREGQSIKNSVVDVNLIKQQMEMQQKRKQTQLVKGMKKASIVKAISQPVQQVQDNASDEFKSCKDSEFS